METIYQSNIRKKTEVIFHKSKDLQIISILKNNNNKIIVIVIIIIIIIIIIINYSIFSASIV